MQFRLRTLLILLALLPPLLWVGWTKYEAWRAEQERQRAQKLAIPIIDLDFTFPIIDEQGEPSPQPGLVPGEPVVEAPGER